MRIIVIGAGMGGLASGIYGQANGFETEIFEAHSVAGGQCASWKRNGCTFDACIHHLFGCEPGTRLYGLWQELGAMPRQLTYPRDCVSVASSDGVVFRDYYDLAKLRDHMTTLSPGDEAAIDEYVAAIRLFGRHDLFGEMMLGSPLRVLGMAPTIGHSLKWFRTTLRQYAGRFRDPLLRAGFPLVEYSMSEAPVALHLAKKAFGARGGIAWPAGGSAQFAESIASRYRELGGRLHLRARVARILTQQDKAVGVALEDGSVHKADYVISNADGRRTLLEMLEGRALDEAWRRYCGPPQNDETNWAVHVFLGVNRDLTGEPSALVLLLDKPVTIAGHECGHLEMQLYGHDPSMAPAGKGVIKVELFSRYSYWKALAGDRARYLEEKQRVADQVIGLLEGHFKGLRSQVEVVDVPTPLTWERYTGGSYGFMTAANKETDLLGGLLGKGALTTLPGLDRLHFVGAWATSAGALFANAVSGRKVIAQICRSQGKRFAPVR